MQNSMKHVKVAAIGGVIVFASVGIGTAAAADVPMPEAELEAPSPEHNRPPPRYYGQEPGERRDEFQQIRFRDAEVRIPPPQAEVLANFDSGMQRFESRRPNRPVSL